MLNFIVVENDTVSNLILAESKEYAELISGTECIEYNPTLVNPKIGQSVVDGEVVDLEVYPELQEDLEVPESAIPGEVYFLDPNDPKNHQPDNGVND
jgi:hypothetical protein